MGEAGVVSVIEGFDHVGVTVTDLERATAFFVGLGLEVEGRAVVDGPFIETVCAIPGATCEVVMLRPPGGGTGLELARFVRPESTPGSPDALATEVGLRNVCFQVTGLRATVERLAGEGYGLVGGIGEHEGTWLMAYVRGPEGIVVSLAEHLS